MANNTALRGAKISLYRKINCYVIPLYNLPQVNKKTSVRLVIICVEICLWRQCSFKNWATTGVRSFSEWVDPYVLWNVDQPGHKFEAAEEASCDNQTCGMWVVSWQTPKDPPTLCCFGYRTDCYTIGTQGVPISQNSSLLASSVWISWCIPSSFSLLFHMCIAHTRSQVLLCFML